jgi:ribosomal protein S18 acetylase RimI-like enzyme
MVAETQTTNVPAICFYRQAGFEFGGIDLSYYTNRDRIDGEVALFMKRKLYE